ncbi:unnamed protein product [Withania somnifera]
MSFGLTNAPLAFMDLMHRVLEPYLYLFVIVFIDDILVYSWSKSDHEQHLELILRTPKEHRLYAKFSKCEFWLESVAFFGHIVSMDGVFVDPTKIRAIRDWPRPTTISKIRSFWSKKCELSFSKLKDLLTLAPVLILPMEGQGFSVYCDGYGIGLGCVLMQTGQVIAYTSRQLKVHERNYPTHDLELAAVVFTLKNWRHYLYGVKCEIFTDHRSL